MVEQTSKKTNMIQSLQVGTSILQILSDYNRPMKFSEILEASGITKSNLYKYVNTLQEAGLLYKNEHTNKFYFGPALIEFGMKAVNTDNMIEQMTPLLEELQEYYGETVLLTRWTMKGPMIVKIINGAHVLNIGAQMGSVLPVFSASGKAYAAFSDGEIGRWKVEQYKDFTTEEKEQLEEELETVKQQTYSFAEEALAPSTASLAVPILDFNHNIIATFTVVGFSERFNHVPLERILEKRRAASKLYGGI
ncbi:IclR family transcriptional regulator [Salibacterium sp. K-3]